MRTLLSFLFASALASAAIPAGAVWMIRSDATAGNVNGAFFNPQNGNFATDGTVDTNTGNTASPVFQTPSYNFASGDVGAWLWVKAGSNTFQVFCEIASVASNKATLTAGAGTCVSYDAANRIWSVATSVGIASTNTPTGITWGINYAWRTAAENSTTNDLATADGDATNCAVTSAGSPFGINHRGNGLKIATSTGWTPDWYEIQNTSGTTATLDKPCGSDGAQTGGNFRRGGAASLASTLDDDLFEKAIAGNDFVVKNGTITFGETVSIGAAGNNQNPVRLIGFNTIVGDAPQAASNQPLLSPTTTTFTFGNYWQAHHVQWTGTAAPVVNVGLNWLGYFVKVANTSSTADRVALSLTAAGATCKRCELISYFGRAGQVNSSGNSVEDSWLHGSKVCLIVTASNAINISGNLISDCTTGISVTAAVTVPLFIHYNTFYGQGQTGTAIDFATGNTTARVKSSIFTRWAIGINHADTTQTSGIDESNLFYSNATNTVGWPISASSYTTIDPSFANVTELTSSGASTTSTAVVQAAGGDGNIFQGAVTDNVDFLTVTSCTGCVGAVPGGKFLITSHTNTTVTVTPAITASSASSITWAIVRGHNFAIGAAAKAKGVPGAFPGGFTTGYMDPGAAQRQEAGGGTRIY